MRTVRPSQIRLPLLSCACAVLAAVFLSGCGGSTNPGSSNAPTTPSTSPAAPTGNASCPALPVTVASGPTTGTATFPAPGQVPPPNPGSTPAGSICVSTPSNGATVDSPAHIAAVAVLANAIDHMRIYVDDLPTYFTPSNTIDALLWMSPGPHQLLILATDKNGSDVSTLFQVNVNGPMIPTTISDIQKLPDWQPCSRIFAPGTARAGQICAAGLGDAVASVTEQQATPSLSGASAKFTIAGPTGYSNELWTKFLGGGTNTTHFTYDMYFMIDKPEVAQALEFDVNQTFGNRRWVFGTECNFKASGKWDVWDGINGWQPTSVDCKPFPANTWIHLVWQFERVGEQVHYISLSINNQTFPLDLYFHNEPTWTMEDIDVAFQMDGDFRQDPYTVWLDKVSMTTW